MAAVYFKTTSVVVDGFNSIRNVVCRINILPLVENEIKKYLIRTMIV